MSIDLHMHSHFSDGTDSACQLVEKVIKSGIKTFSVTDHDTVDFYENFDFARLGDVKLICGIEFSCVTEAGKCHILGYGIDYKNGKLSDTVRQTHELRNTKLVTRLSFLEKERGIAFSEEEREYLFSRPSTGKLHIAEVVVKKGLAETVWEAVSEYLTGMPDELDRISAGDAIGAIISAGGIPVWAHPIGGEGEKRLSQEEFERQLKILVDFGIKGLECYYSRYSEGEIQLLLQYAKKNNILVSGGSDYHGTAKNIPLGMLCNSPSAELYSHIANNLSILQELGSSL